MRLLPVHSLRSLRKHFRLFGANGLIRRGLISVSNASNLLEATIPNSSDSVFIRLGTTDVAAFEHVFIDDEYGFSLAKRPSVIVDVGTNIGMSAVYFSRRYPDATIFAIEPEPANFNILKKNAKMFPSIVPINAALWSHDGFIQIFDGGHGSWGTQVREGDDFSGDSVKSLKLDTLLFHYGIHRIDLLKIDIEGAECEVFKNAQMWIGRIEAICIELHDRFRAGCTDAFESATADFNIRWRRGELVCVARKELTS